MNTYWTLRGRQTLRVTSGKGCVNSSRTRARKAKSDVTQARTKYTADERAEGGERNFDKSKEVFDVENFEG